MTRRGSNEAGNTLSLRDLTVLPHRTSLAGRTIKRSASLVRRCRSKAGDLRSGETPGDLVRGCRSAARGAYERRSDSLPWGSAASRSGNQAAASPAPAPPSCTRRRISVAEPRRVQKVVIRKQKGRNWPGQKPRARRGFLFVWIQQTASTEVARPPRQVQQGRIRCFSRVAGWLRGLGGNPHAPQRCERSGRRLSPPVAASAGSSGPISPTILAPPGMPYERSVDKAKVLTRPKSRWALKHPSLHTCAFRRYS